jgi:hypothetical protein
MMNRGRLVPQVQGNVLTGNINMGQYATPQSAHQSSIPDQTTHFGLILMMGAPWSALSASSLFPTDSSLITIGVP